MNIIETIVFSISKLLPWSNKSWLHTFGRLLLSKILRYRSETILENIAQAPLFSVIDGIKIRNEYYARLTQYIIEILKSFSISEAQLLTKVRLVNGYVEKLHPTKRNIIMSNHLGNWELISMALPKLIGKPIEAVYKPLSNIAINELLYKNRSKFGLRLIDMGGILRKIANHMDDGACYLFINDQSPPKNYSGKEVLFLGRPTIFYNGIEKIIKKHDCAVWYLKVKIESDTYMLDIEEIDTCHVIEDYASKLERDILKYPSYWLWSHKRWKHY